MAPMNAYRAIFIISRSEIYLDRQVRFQNRYLTLDCLKKFEKTRFDKKNSFKKLKITRKITFKTSAN